MSFGESLKKLRESRGFGVNQLALKAGISASQISRYENGSSNNPTAEKIKQLATALNDTDQVLMQAAGLSNIDEYKSPTADLLQVSNEPYMIASQKIPVYGEIHAGNPTYADETIIGNIHVTVDFQERYGKENLFALRVVGDSMSKVVPEGFTAVFAKGLAIDNGDIVAVLIDGQSAAIKHYKETSMAYIFEPDSYNPVHQPIVVQKSDPNGYCKILGKYLYATSESI